MFNFRVQTKKQKLTAFSLLLFLVVGGVFWYANLAAGATYTWDGGGGDGLWSTCTNWTSDTCPGAADIAQFTSANTTNSIVDASFAGSVAGISVTSGYTGTITQQRNLTIGSSGFTQAGGTWAQGTTIFDINDGSFTLSNGTFMTGVGTSSIERSFTLSGGTYTASSTSNVTFDGSQTPDDTTLTCTGDFGGTFNVAKSYFYADFVLANGCEATTTSVVSTTGTFTNNGILHLGTSLDVNNSFTNNGTTTMTGSSINVEFNFSQNGIFDLTGKTVTFDGGNTGDHSTLTCTGDFGGTVDVAKTSPYADFTLASGCNAVATTITTSGNLTINGVLATGGNTLTGLSLTINGTLRRYGTETVTTPTLGNNSIIDYYGPSTYSTLGGWTDFKGLSFSGGGTYNISSAITVEDNFTSTNDSVFNQTAGGTTLDGTNQTVTGTSTFYTLSKSVTSAATLTFGANQTQTISSILTLQGSSGNQLTVQSSATGTEYYLDMQGFRTLEYLTLSDANNTDATVAYCDPGCIDGNGNNTNINFSANPDGSYIYWDGGGADSNWSTCTNWTYNTCPTSAYTAAFDERDTSASTLDASFAGEVLGLTIESGYTNTITSNRSLTVGTDGFLQADGTFIAPASILTLYGDYTQTGGTFTANGGLTRFNGTHTLSPSSGTTFNDLFIGYGEYDSYTFSHWRLDESSAGSSVVDVTGNGYTGTPAGTGGANNYPQPSATTPSAIDFNNSYSLDFDGTDDYVNIPYNAAMNGTDNLSVSFWMYANATGNYRTPIARWYETGANRTWTVSFVGNKLRFYTSTSGSDFPYVETPSTITTNTWYHVVLVNDSSNGSTGKKIYLNGTAVVSGAGTSIANTSTAIRIGSAQSFGGAGVQYFDGLIDDVRIYTTPLSLAQVQALYAGDEYLTSSYASVDLSSNTLDVNGDLSIFSGSTLDTSASGCSSASCNVTVAGDWSNYGNFVSQTGTVTLNGSNQTISGNTGFYNLTKSVTSPDTITFSAGSDTSVKNNLILKGTAGNLLTATSSSDGTAWSIKANRNVSTIEYVNLNDSNNTDVYRDLYCFPGCTDGGGNTRWQFLSATPAPRDQLRVGGNIRLLGGIRFAPN